jgi:hypothetical protein
MISPVCLGDPYAFAQVQEFNLYLCATLHVAHSHRMRGYRRPYNPLAQAPYLAPPFSLTTPGGSAQRRGDAAGRHGPLHRRFQADDVDRARVGAAAAAVAR